MLSFNSTDENDGHKVEKLYQLYRKHMCGIAREILHDSHLAEDAVHLSFERIMKNLHKVDEIESPKTKSLLVVICKNVSLSMLNKRSKHEQLAITEDAEIGSGPDKLEPDTIVVSQDTIKTMSNIINNLNPIYKDVMILRVDYEYTYAQIAELLDIKVETVRKRLLRGRELILKEMKRRGYNG